MYDGISVGLCTPDLVGAPIDPPIDPGAPGIIEPGLTDPRRGAIDPAAPGIIDPGLIDPRRGATDPAAPGISVDLGITVPLTMDALCCTMLPRRSFTPKKACSGASVACTSLKNALIFFIVSDGIILTDDRKNVLAFLISPSSRYSTIKFYAASPFGYAASESLNATIASSMRPRDFNEHPKLLRIPGSSPRSNAFK